MVTATGSIAGISQIIPATVGQTDAAGVCGGVVNAVVITAVPGQTTATGVTAGLSSMISAPPAQMDCSADITGLLCVLTAVPALGFVTGGVTGVKCLSLTSGVKRRYACRIECDGFDDIIVPVSAFSSRQRRGYPSYSEITIPGLHRFAEVALRSEGVFVVSVILTKDGEDLLMVDIFNASIDKMTITGNQSLQHMVISGTRPAEENKGPQIAPLQGVIYRRQSYGETIVKNQGYGSVPETRRHGYLRWRQIYCKNRYPHLFFSRVFYGSEGVRFMNTTTVSCKMTKAGLADLMIPISSFQVFKRRDGTMGLQVTTRRFDLSGAIAARSKGHIVLTANVNGALEEVGTAKVSRIRLDEGPMNKSITIQATAE